MPDDFDVPFEPHAFYSKTAVKIESREPIFKQGYESLGLDGDMMRYLNFNYGWQLWLRPWDGIGNPARARTFEMRNYAMTTGGYFQAWKEDGEWVGDGNDTIIAHIHTFKTFSPAGREIEEPEIVVRATLVEPPRAGARPGDVSGAMKLDAGRAPMFNGFVNYFPRAMEAVAWVSEYGYRKYGEWGGWRKVKDGIARYHDSHSRHHVKQAIEVYDDGDSGLAHAVQDAWNALAKVELMIAEGKVEVRRGNEIVDGKPVLGTARKV